MITNQSLPDNNIPHASSHPAVKYKAGLNATVLNAKDKSNSSHETINQHEFKLKHKVVDSFYYQLEFPLKREKLLDSYRLRARVFCQELKWVGDDNTSFEIDEFDKNSNHLGAINSKGAIVGTLRFTSHQHEWFMEKFFPQLLPENFHELKLPTSVEVSRMAIENNLRARCMADGKGLADLLYKGVFSYCQVHKISHVYIIASNAVLKFLRIHRMPVRTIGPKVVMPDGVEAVAAVVDWNNLYQSDNIKDRIFLEWLKKPTRCHNEWLWPQPVRGSSH